MTDISTNETSRAEGGANTAPTSSTAGNAKRQLAATSKTDLVLKKLRGAKGASLAQLSELTGWQAHSVRGFLSGTVRKKLGLNLTSDAGKDGVRRYRISDLTEGTPS